MHEHGGRRVCFAWPSPRYAPACRPLDHHLLRVFSSSSSSTSRVCCQSPCYLRLHCHIQPICLPDLVKNQNFSTQTNPRLSEGSPVWPPPTGYFVWPIPTNTAKPLFSLPPSLFCVPSSLRQREAISHYHAEGAGKAGCAPPERDLPSLCR